MFANFEQFIAKNLNVYQKAKLKRIDELVDSMILKKSKSGTFELHEGFQKDCGNKGQKLSGG